MSPEEIHERWPSTTWGEAEWFAVLQGREDVYLALLGGLAHVRTDTAHARRVWHSMQRGPRKRRTPRLRGVPTRWRVLHAVAYGMHQSDIADMLDLPLETVRSSLYGLRQARGRHTTAGLVADAVRELEPELPPLTAPDISPAPLQVLVHTARGMTRPQIAAELDRQPMTVKTHRQYLFRAFDVQHTVGLVSRAFAAGVLELRDGQAVPAMA